MLTADALGARMAGPAIRALELARRLHAGGCGPTLATPHLSDDLAPQPFPVRRYDVERPEKVLRPLLAESDALFAHITEIAALPFITRAKLPRIVDLYDPILFESMAVEAATGLPLAPRRHSTSGLVAAIEFALAAGDYFLCASERQRDLWLGALMMLGRVTPMAVDEDPTLRRLIDVVPFGIPGEPPARGAPGAFAALRPPLEARDRVLLWGGGIWNWFDPLTLIRGFHALAQKRADVRLVFLGGRHPNPEVTEMRMQVEARSLAASLGLLDRSVHFLDGWVPYAERGGCLLDSALGVSTHPAHVESHFSFRTRLLDCLWAGLPIVCTRGDVVAELVERESLGLTVPPGDPAALAAAIARLLDDEPLAARCRTNLARVAPEFHWSRVAEPLVRYCHAPRRAADADESLRRVRAKRAIHVTKSAARVLLERGPIVFWNRAALRLRSGRRV